MKVIKKISNCQAFYRFGVNLLTLWSQSGKVDSKLASTVWMRDLVHIRIVNNYSAFSSLISEFLTIIKNQKLVGFVELDLVGLGFRVRKLTSNVYRFFFGKANFLYLFNNDNVIFRSYSNDSLKIRRVYILGVNLSLVNNVSAAILLLQPLNSYRVTGIVDPRKVIVLRSGKQR